MFTYNEKDYELKFNIKRLEIIEKATGKSSVGMMVADNNGIMGVSSVMAFYSYGLKEAGADTFVAPKVAQEICEARMNEIGYMEVVKELQGAIQHDCPFLFRGV